MKHMKPILLLIVLLFSLIATPIQAGVFEWRGPVDSAWESPGNWFVNLFPVASFPDTNDYVMFFSFSPNTLVELDGNREIIALSFQAPPVDYSIIAGLAGSTLTLSSGDLFASGFASHAITNVTLGDEGDWVIDNPQLEVTGVLTGPRLNKSGIGTLLLTGGTNASPSTAKLSLTADALI